MNTRSYVWVMLGADGVSEMHALGEPSTIMKWYGDAHSILRRAAREQQTTMETIGMRGSDDQRGVTKAQSGQRWSRMHDRPGWSRLAACD